jgi:hypothetical protein
MNLSQSVTTIHGLSVTETPPPPMCPFTTKTAQLLLQHNFVTHSLTHSLKEASA